MRKTFFAVILILLFATGPLMAQKQLYFGVAGTGLSSAIINQNNYGATALDEKVTMGGSGNVNIGMDFNNHIGLKLEVGFAKLGQKYEKMFDVAESSTSIKVTRNVKLNYLQVPLLFKFRTGGKVGRFYLQVGPQFNFMLSASQDYLADDVTVSAMANTKSDVPFDIGQEKIKERYNSLDIMGRLDLGVDIQVATNLSLNVGLIMAYGLTDINATDYQLEDADKNYNPSHNVYGGINVGLNYLLPIGSK